MYTLVEAMTPLEKLAKEHEDLMEMDDERYLSDLGSKCFVYSRSKHKWYKGQISDIYIDSKTSEEWLIVKYNGNKRKKIQRLCKDFRPNTVQGLWQIYLIYGYTRQADIKIYGDLIGVLIAFYGVHFGDTWNIETSHPDYTILADQGIIKCPPVKPTTGRNLPPYMNAFGANIVSKGEIAKWKLRVLEISENMNRKRAMNIVFGIIDVAKAPYIAHSEPLLFCYGSYAAGIGYNGYLGYVYDGTSLENYKGINGNADGKLFTRGFDKLYYPHCIEMTLDLRDEKGGRLVYKLHKDKKEVVFSDQIDLDRQYHVALGLRGERILKVQLINLDC